MRTIVTRACGLKFPTGKSFRRGGFAIAAALAIMLIGMRARARDLPVRLGCLEAPRASEDLRRSVKAGPKARDD